MNRIGWVVLLLLGALALAAYQGRSRPPRMPAAASEPASSLESPSASAPAAPDPRPANGSRDQRHPGGAGGSPRTEPGTTAGIEGILAGSKTTPHVEDAAQKARNAMRNMREAEDRERAALGGGGSASNRGQPSRPPEEP